MTSDTISAFDVHVHVDKGLDLYDLAVHGKNIIFNEVQAYKSDRDRYRSQTDCLTLIIDLGQDFDFVRQEAESGRIQALKIHSRIQKIKASDYGTVMERIALLPSRLPIVLDAFYYGRDLDCQPSLPAIARVLSTFPDRLFVIAHSGGYRLLEYFFHLREFKNCYYDLSLTLQYFEDSSLRQDLRKLVKYTDKTKLMYGSDHPYASARRQYDTLAGICGELSLSQSEIDNIFGNNARMLFGPGGQPGMKA